MMNMNDVCELGKEFVVQLISFSPYNQSFSMAINDESEWCLWIEKKSNYRYILFSSLQNIPMALNDESEWYFWSEK